MLYRKFELIQIKIRFFTNFTICYMNGNFFAFVRVGVVSTVGDVI